LDLLTARIGYTVAPNWLLYVEGGAAWRNSDLKLFSREWHPSGPVSAIRERVGRSGLVPNTCFARRWSVFLDYKYANFAPDSINIVAPGVIAPFIANANTNSHYDYRRRELPLLMFIESLAAKVMWPITPTYSAGIDVGTCALAARAAAFAELSRVPRRRASPSGSAAPVRRTRMRRPLAVERDFRRHRPGGLRSLRAT